MVHGLSGLPEPFFPAVGRSLAAEGHGIRKALFGLFPTACYLRMQIKSLAAKMRALGAQDGKPWHFIRVPMLVLCLWSPVHTCALHTVHAHVQRIIRRLGVCCSCHLHVTRSACQSWGRRGRAHSSALAQLDWITRRFSWSVGTRARGYTWR